MDVAAEELGLDRVAIRDANLVSEFPHRAPTGLILDLASHRETLATAAELADLGDFAVRQAKAASLAATSASASRASPSAPVTARRRSRPGRARSEPTRRSR